MSTTSHPPVPIRLGTATGGTEEGRAFFQSRLQLLGGWTFLISGTCNLTELVVTGWFSRFGSDSGPVGIPNVFHMLARRRPVSSG